MSGFGNLRGLADLNKRLSALPKDVATKLGQSANRAGAAVLAKKAKALAPVGPVAEGAEVTRKRKSGAVVKEKHHKIKNSIKVKKTKNVSQTRVQNTVTTGQAYQASFVEFGSIHNAPNPFMKNAFEQNKDEIVATMAAALVKGLTRKGV